LSRVHVVHVLGSGEQSARGIALTVLNLTELLDASRYRLSVIFLRDDGPIGDVLRSRGVEVLGAGWHRGRADIPGAMRFARALRTFEPDIVHMHAGGLSPRIVSKIAAGAKVVVHFHSLQEEAKVEGITRRSPIAADLVIANSNATAESVKRAKPLVIYPGVVVPPVRRSYNEIRPIRIVGTAARLARVKGIEYLIEAVSHLENVHLEIAGDGPERAELERKVAVFGVTDEVTFTGWIDDVGKEMSTWDMYAQPSLAEGLGIAALEAMAHGIPVVASDVGGLREIIVDSETGFLVSPKSPGRLAERIRELAANGDLRARLGDAGRTRAATHFSRERECAAIQSAYEKLLA
jgi:glycosyltransferase involved in cell wall biosynthesis